MADSRKYRIAYWTLFFLLFLAPMGIEVRAQSLTVSDNGRYLVQEDGRAFFWLGDTAWELFHRLDREEANLYLERRASQGFTVIQAVVLAELDGLTVPNAYGQTPLLDNDPCKPNEAYFEHVDDIVDKARRLGLYIAMLPTWGDKFNRKWGVGPEIFTPENAKSYGEFLGKRYRNRPAIWILGGDRDPEDDVHYAIVRAMAEGLRKGDRGKHPIGYHPQGCSSSSDFFHQESWLDFNLFQSGHGEANSPNYKMTLRDYRKQPSKPVLDGEPNYEDHPIDWNPSKGWFDEFDSRRAGYGSMLSGAMGHTYGNHNIWQMWQPGRVPVSFARMPWRQALKAPGAFQAGMMRRLFESRPWWLLLPDESLLCQGPVSNGKEVRVAVASDRSFLVAYSPFGSSFALSLNPFFSDPLHAWWFDPRTGASMDAGVIASSTSEVSFDPPGEEIRGNDWVLVLDVDPAQAPPGILED